MCHLRSVRLFTVILSINLVDATHISDIAEVDAREDTHPISRAERQVAERARCPQGERNTRGMEGLPEDELWCQCPRKATSVSTCPEECVVDEYDGIFYKYGCADCECSLATLSSITCSDVGAEESDNDGFCRCPDETVCLGAGCKQDTDYYYYFELAMVSVDKTGQLMQEIRGKYGAEFLTAIGRFSGGCVKLQCGAFNADLAPFPNCRCPADTILMEGDAKSKGGPEFPVQEASDFDYRCVSQGRCPTGLRNSRGMPGRPEHELWCQCPRGRVPVDECPDECALDDGGWFYNHDSVNCRACECD